MVLVLVWWLPLLLVHRARLREYPDLSPISDEIILIDEADGVQENIKPRGEEKKLRHKNKPEQKKPDMVQKGGYKTSEKIHKPPKFDHPCNLTRTSVKISFPALKDELFVNFLGYKEPNLVYLWRCKGVCGETSTSVACSPTRVTEKKVNMMFKVKVRCVSLLS